MISYKKILIILISLLPLFSFSQKEMSFERNTNLIIVNVEVNKQPFKFVFDNGAQTSVLFCKKEDFSKYKKVDETFIIDNENNKKNNTSCRM